MPPRRSKEDGFNAAAAGGSGLGDGGRNQEDETVHPAGGVTLVTELHARSGDALIMFRL